MPETTRVRHASALLGTSARRRGGARHVLQRFAREATVGTPIFTRSRRASRRPPRRSRRRYSRRARSRGSRGAVRPQRRDLVRLALAPAPPPPPSVHGDVQRAAPPCDASPVRRVHRQTLGQRVHGDARLVQRFVPRIRSRIKHAAAARFSAAALRDERPPRRLRGDSRAGWSAARAAASPCFANARAKEAAPFRPINLRGQRVDFTRSVLHSLCVRFRERSLERGETRRAAPPLLEPAPACARVAAPPGTSSRETPRTFARCPASRVEKARGASGAAASPKTSFAPRAACSAASQEKTNRRADGTVVVASVKRVRLPDSMTRPAVRDGAKN